MNRTLADTAGHGVNANRVVMDISFVTLVLGHYWGAADRVKAGGCDCQRARRRDLTPLLCHMRASRSAVAAQGDYVVTQFTPRPVHSFILRRGDKAAELSRGARVRARSRPQTADRAALRRARSRATASRARGGAPRPRRSARRARLSRPHPARAPGAHRRRRRRPPGARRARPPPAPRARCVLDVLERIDSSSARMIEALRTEREALAADEESIRSSTSSTLRRSSPIVSCRSCGA